MNERSFGISQVSEIINTKQKCVVDAARRLLATEGLHGLSIKLLVKESGVAAGTIYLHFKDKQDIIRQVHASVLHEVGRAISHNHDAEMPLFDQYQSLWRNLWTYFEQHPNTLMVKAQLDHLPKGALKQDLKDVRASFQVVSDLFNQGRTSGQIRDLPDEVLGALSFETCATLARQQLLGLLEIDDQMLENCILASWQAIVTCSDNSSKTEKQI